MSILALGQSTTDRIAPVVAYAHAHPFSLKDLQEVVTKGRVLGNDPAFRCELDFGYRCVFTVECHPVGWCRHLSISVDRPGKLPAGPAVLAISGLFGLHRPVDLYAYGEKTAIFLETLNAPGGAVNVIQFYPEFCPPAPLS